jgi:hypothetical protein
MKTNNTQVATIEEVLISGNLANLSPPQRIEYYSRVCDELKLNPLTRPFDYIVLNGKLVLYLNKGGADQLRRVQNISIYKIESRTENDIFIVTAYARDGSGREDTSTGTVSIAGLKGEALANALLKAETKSKRRVTISMGGLGMLDESEIESIRNVNPGAVALPDFVDHPMVEKVLTDKELDEVIVEKIAAIKNKKDEIAYNAWKADNIKMLNNFIANNKQCIGKYKAMLDDQLAKIAIAGELNGLHIPESVARLAKPLTFN